jgi:hypothetical protein
MNRLVPWTRKTGLFCRPHHLIRWTAEPPDQLKARKKRLALAKIWQAFTFPFLSVYADFSDRPRIASEENSEPGFFLEANSSPILIPHRTAKTKKEQITCLNSLQAAALKLRIFSTKKKEHFARSVVSRTLSTPAIPGTTSVSQICQLGI